ncbi:hypothetical protein [Kitasatospora sp. KL5]|uniref:hypothetical protein n=1 Tax=Kitasatospora sp. KL5 TaxID=3425125 RepID=UPI003D6DBDBF
MPLDDTLYERMGEPDFWPRYLFEDGWDGEDSDEEDDEDAVEAHRAEFGLGDGPSLVLDVELDNEYVGLGLRLPGQGEPVELGWDDQAHFHPHVMRWAELELLARAFALHDPALRHPGPVLALLARFVMLDEGDTADVITPLVDAAFGLVRPGGEAPGGAGVRAETRDWFELRDLRGTGLTWTDEGRRSAVSQPDDPRTIRPLYSLRQPGAEDFPFEGWGELLARAAELVGTVASDPALDGPGVRAALKRCTGARGYGAVGGLADALRAAGYGGFGAEVLLRALETPVSRAEACWAVETLAGLAPGTVVRRWFGRSPLTDARYWDLLLTLPADVPGAAAHAMDDALRAAGLGWAEIVGSTSTKGPDGTYRTVSTTVDIRVRDSLERGVAAVAEVLRRFDAASTAELRHEAAPYERIALD